MSKAAANKDKQTALRESLNKIIKKTGVDPDAYLSVRITSSKQAGTMMVLANALVESFCDFMVCNSLAQEEKARNLKNAFRETTFYISKLTKVDPKATISMPVTSVEQAGTMMLLACTLMEPAIDVFRELYEKMEGTYQERKPFSLMTQKQKQPYCRITGQPCDKIVVPIDDKKSKDVCIKAKCTVAKNFYRLAQELQKTK